MVHEGGQLKGLTNILILCRGLISAMMLDFTSLMMGLSFSFDAHTICMAIHTAIMDDMVGQPSFMTPRMPSFSGLRRSTRLSASVISLAADMPLL